ncbi:MAG TPA: acyl-CoA thioesterase [Chromatiaceae bacterium]|nr:acyl-CoA thioesterase [Chromatiaceae bacterium]
MTPEAAYSFRVRLHDIDAAGVMFFGHLFRHAHDAYESFMAGLGWPLTDLIQTGVLLPLVHAEADYRQPLRHGEEIRVEVACEHLGRSSFTIGYGFYDAQGGLRATARTVHVHLGPDSAGKAPLPEAIRSALSLRYDPRSVR